MPKQTYKLIIIICTLLLLAFSVNAEQKKLSIQMESVSLVSVLNLIAEQYNLNLVISNDVQGDISVKLNEVDVYTALNAILHPSGYNYYFDDNIIVIKSMEKEAAGEFRTEVIRLKYVNPITAKKALSSIKSEKGDVIILDKMDEGTETNEVYHPNKILITDYPKNIEAMLKVIDNLDVEEKLISIEVKIVETTLDSQDKLGFNWPTQINTQIGSSSVETTDETSGTNDNGLGTYDLETSQWTWGKLTINQMNVFLDLLKQRDNSKLVSYPSVSTLENHEAEIKIQTVIPIPTINRFTESASTTDFVTFYDEEVGIRLNVTPRINSDGQITMDVYNVVEDIIGYTGSSDSQKPITAERSIKTRITVGNGETATLGGLLKESDIQVEKKVPGLSLIPILGKLLFTSHSIEKKTTDLLIMITPTIIE